MTWYLKFFFYKVLLKVDILLDLLSHAGFLSGFFSGGGKIYCFSNFYCYANFSIIFGPNFTGDKGLAGGGGGAPVEESQHGHII